MCEIDSLTTDSVKEVTEGGRLKNRCIVVRGGITSAPDIHVELGCSVVRRDLKGPLFKTAFFGEPS